MAQTFHANQSDLQALGERRWLAIGPGAGRLQGVPVRSPVRLTAGSTWEAAVGPSLPARAAGEAGTGEMPEQRPRFRLPTRYRLERGGQGALGRTTGRVAQPPMTASIAGWSQLWTHSWLAWPSRVGMTQTVNDSG
jgi:hypothetical protein